MEFYFKNSLLGWAVKDSSSRYVYANDRACKYFNIPSERIHGCSDRDLINDIDSVYENIMLDDQKITNTGRMSIALKIFSYGENGELKAYRVEKRRWCFKDGSPGIICSYIELANVYFSTFITHTSRRSLVFTKPSDFFTDREWEVILLLFCSMKQHIMSDILGISTFTLRNRIIRCCQKAGVLNTSSLLQYCYCQGWDNYIPPYFLNKRYLVIEQ